MPAVHTRILAVGERQPAWVAAAVAHYAGRLPSAWRFRVDTVPAGKRGKAGAADRARDAESRSLLSATRDEFRVLLDEQGKGLSSRTLAGQLSDWHRGGRDLCFMIGGADGVSPALHERADFVWCLSPLTLPHGLARILCAEQLYRAWSLHSGHPYHRA